MPSLTIKIAVEPFPTPSLSIQMCPSIRFTNLIQAMRTIRQKMITVVSVSTSHGTKFPGNVHQPKKKNSMSQSAVLNYHSKPKTAFNTKTSEVRYLLQIARPSPVPAEFLVAGSWFCANLQNNLGKS